MLALLLAGASEAAVLLIAVDEDELVSLLLLITESLLELLVFRLLLLRVALLSSLLLTALVGAALVLNPVLVWADWPPHPERTSRVKQMLSMCSGLRERIVKLFMLRPDSVMTGDKAGLREKPSSQSRFSIIG